MPAEQSMNPLRQGSGATGHASGTRVLRLGEHSRPRVGGQWISLTEPTRPRAVRGDFHLSKPGKRTAAAKAAKAKALEEVSV